jgi:hypothetical protein
MRSTMGATTGGLTGARSPARRPLPGLAGSCAAVVVLSAGAVLAGCGFTDSQSDNQPPFAVQDGGDGTVMDSGTVLDGAAADAVICHESFGEFERLSDLAPTDRHEGDPAIAQTPSGQLFVVWIDRPNAGAPGTLRVASGTHDSELSETDTLSGCIAVGEPTATAMGEDVIVAALCSDVGGRICDYALDSKSGLWAGPTIVDDTGVGPSRASPRLAATDIEARMAWVEDEGVRTSTTTSGATWTSSVKVEETGHAANDCALAIDDSATWLAYTHGEDSDAAIVVRTSDGSDEFSTFTTITRLEGAQDPALAVSAGNAALAYHSREALRVMRTDAALILDDTEIGGTTGSPRIAGSPTGPLHVLAPDGESLHWLHVPLGAAELSWVDETVPDIVPIDSIDIVALDDRATLLWASTALDVEVFRSETQCAP